MLSASKRGGVQRPAVLALALALVALIALTASAAAEPPTTTGPADVTFTPLALRVTAPRADGTGTEPVVVAAPVGPFLETGGAPVPTLVPRPRREAPMGVTVKPTPRPRLDVAGGDPGGGHVLRGAASWYCRAGVSVCHNQYPDTGGFDAYAAAGPRLRAALGSWRGRVVFVDGVRVKLVDWCQCYKGQSNEKLIDLYYDVYRRAGGSVTIRW